MTKESWRLGVALLHFLCAFAFLGLIYIFKKRRGLLIKCHFPTTTREEPARFMPEYFVSQKVFKKLWIRGNSVSELARRYVNQSKSRLVAISNSASVSTPPRETSTRRPKALSWSKMLVLNWSPKWSYCHVHHALALAITSDLRFDYHFHFRLALSLQSLSLQELYIRRWKRQKPWIAEGYSFFFRLSNGM